MMGEALPRRLAGRCISFGYWISRKGLSLKFVEELATEKQVPFGYVQSRLRTPFGAKDAPNSAQDDSFLCDE
jgi:hypothetical protein